MVAPEGLTAMCVQRFDDSRNSAIHTTYRILLRSSSLREPRYPLLRVVSSLLLAAREARSGFHASVDALGVWKKKEAQPARAPGGGGGRRPGPQPPPRAEEERPCPDGATEGGRGVLWGGCAGG